MYIGSTDTRGLMHCLWEIIDNGVDEALAGVAGRVEVTMHPDGSVEVYDDGRGIPTDKEPKTGLPGVEVVATKLHAGGKFGGSSYAATGGLHGVGLSVVNALSSRMDIDVDRAPAQQGMSFRRGVPGVFEGDGPDAKFTPASGLTRKGPKVAKTKHGTRIRFWPDKQIFTKDARFEIEGLLGRARQTSFIVPGLELVIRDLRVGADDGGPIEEKFRHDGGIAEFVDFLAKDQPVTDVLRLQGSDTFTETVPMLDDSGQMTPQDVERELLVDVAVRWGTGYETEIRSFVNVIATPKGGTHVSGFEGAVTKTFNDAMKATKVLKVNDQDVIKEDVMEGLTAVVTVRLAEPQFEGQTKEILGTPAARSVVRKVVAAELRKFLTASKGQHKQQAKLVMEKVYAASKTRLTLRQQKENQRRKNALESSALPAKLADCRVSDERAELFIVEGDSALGTAKLARDSEYQALLPIRGKILNVQRASVGDMLKNAECASIIQVVGAGTGRSFDLDAARYQKIIFMADADSDGAHIRTLLATLFFKYMPELIEKGRVYSAVPPLHRVELSNPKKGMDKYIYTYSDDELQRKLAELKKRNVSWKEPVQRYKGLGEMDADQLAETTMDPRRRTLRRLTVDDADAAAEVFELLMGTEVAPRKEFIVAGGGQLSEEDLDF